MTPGIFVVYIRVPFTLNLLYMEISEWPYDDRFHEEVKQVEASDPEIEKFFFDLGSESKQSRKNLMISQKYREIMKNLSSYTESQILQWASVFLNFGTDAQLYAGTMMKEWKAKNGTTKEDVDDLRSATTQETSNVLE